MRTVSIEISVKHHLHYTFEKLWSEVGRLRFNNQAHNMFRDGVDQTQYRLDPDLRSELDDGMHLGLEAG